MFNSFGLSAMSWLVNQFQTVWVVAFVILFQPEIRRLLIYVGQTRFFQRIFKMGTSRSLEAIVDASYYIRDVYNISTALRRTEVFPSILLQLASTGEDTGELDDLLDRAADYYQKQVDALVDRMTTLIEPLLILMVGAVIALMVVLTYLPVFHLGSALQSGL